MAFPLPSASDSSDILMQVHTLSRLAPSMCSDGRALIACIATDLDRSQTHSHTTCLPVQSCVDTPCLACRRIAALQSPSHSRGPPISLMAGLNDNLRQASMLVSLLRRLTACCTHSHTAHPIICDDYRIMGTCLRQKARNWCSAFFLAAPRSSRGAGGSAQMARSHR